MVRAVRLAHPTLTLVMHSLFLQAKVAQVTTGKAGVFVLPIAMPAMPTMAEVVVPQAMGSLAVCAYLINVQFCRRAGVP